MGAQHLPKIEDLQFVPRQHDVTAAIVKQERLVSCESRNIALAVQAG